ncbi:protein ASYMMETRIC LEAVES 2-like [Andrographis paniculata]|uniref:protein ASYMMETRIC LEAVES 2-like n=1 Tax=Andrographis paniculata TaxID=175694 RepID=UPI0021E81306|nr:protein ASYMMETRIC LEAVES 2-like [Andrographis paniculata]
MNYCASCRYRRSRCSSSCPLAPYFPANEEGERNFQAVHRVFGVNRIANILRQIESSDLRDDAVRSHILEAQYRLQYPVYGSVAVIVPLLHQTRQALLELDRLLNLLPHNNNTSTPVLNDQETSGNDNPNQEILRPPPQ